MTDLTTPPEPGDRLAGETTRATLRVQHAALNAARDYLTSAGFVEVLLPVIGPVTDPGGRGSKQLDVDYYGHRYKLMTSAILYKQASLLAFDRIFCVAPNVRLEPLETAATHRHLAEFHQLDVEMAEASREQVFGLLQGLVKHIVTTVLTQQADQFRILGRDTGMFKDLLEEPFGQVGHGQAVKQLHDVGHDQDPDTEIDWVGEEILSRKSSRPFFITDYPKGSRGFYDRESRTEVGVLRNFDLIAPEGYGELCSGSEREFEYSRIVERMRETGENPAKYGWYLRMVRRGLRPSAGFGLGVERLTRYLAGLDAVWQANAFPKVPGVVSP